MRQRPGSRWGSWRVLAGLVLLAALAQACGGSGSQSTGPGGGRAELRFDQVKGARLNALPAGCQQVQITAQPGNHTATAAGDSVSLLLPAGTYTLSGVLTCGGQQFPSTNNPQIVVPPGLGSVNVTLVFGDVHAVLTVVTGPGVRVTGPGIDCPGDCTETFLKGASAALKATPGDTVFTGGCGGTGSCTVTLNGNTTVTARRPEPEPEPPPPPAPQTGTITVANLFCCVIDFLIDGVLVANDLTNDNPPVVTTVTAGPHVVQGTCVGVEPFPATNSPQNVNVPPNGNVTVDNMTCD